MRQMWLTRWILEANRNHYLQTQPWSLSTWNTMHSAGGFPARKMSWTGEGPRKSGQKGPENREPAVQEELEGLGLWGGDEWGYNWVILKHGQCIQWFRKEENNHTLYPQLQNPSRRHDPPPPGDIWGLVWDKQEIPFFGTKLGSLTVGRRRGESSVYVRKTELRLQEWKSWWGGEGRQVDGSGCPTSASLILTISLCSPKMTWASACSSQFRAQTETGNMDPFMTRSHTFRAGLCRETETAAGPCRRTHTSPAPASTLDTRRRSQGCPLHLSLQRTMTPPPCAWGRWWRSRAWCRAAAEILRPSGDQKGNLLAVVQLLSWVRLCNSVDWSTQGFPVPHHLSEFAETHVHWTDDAIQPSHSLLPLPLWPSSFPSIRVFSNESVLHIRWPEY